MFRRYVRLLPWAIAAAGFLVGPAAGATTLDPPALDPPLPVDVPVEVPVDGPAATAAGSRAAGTPLTGTFRLTKATCGGEVSGTWFRMIQPGGDADGPFVSNSDSPCADTSYTPLAPGSDGGLVTGAYQPQPNPAFSTTGHALARRITAPARFFGVDFGTATNAVDPQTGTAVPAPTINATGGTLSGDLRAFAASWNNQHFNQGAPKPDGSTPGATAAPTGTYDAATGAFTIKWTSQIVGGPFNNFTGQWHLEGTFVGAATSGAAASPASSSAQPDPAATTFGPAAAASTGALASTGPALPEQTIAIAFAFGCAALMLSSITRRARTSDAAR